MIPFSPTNSFLLIFEMQIQGIPAPLWSGKINKALFCYTEKYFQSREIKLFCSVSGTAVPLLAT